MTHHRAVCSIGPCESPAHTRGFCNSHYYRLYKYGDPLAGGPRRTPPKPCSVPACERLGRTRGYCKTHYYRWSKYGDPTWVPKRPTLEERVWARLDVGHPLGCWEWTAGLQSEGYGLVSQRLGGRHAPTEKFYVHRLVYTWLIGPIPDGLHIDHLCRNRRCANPDHLQPVTQAENIRRGMAPTMRKRRALVGEAT